MDHAASGNRRGLIGEVPVTETNGIPKRSIAIPPHAGYTLSLRARRLIEEAFMSARRSI